MTPPAASAGEMMHAAHVVTGGAAGLLTLLFLGGVALYLWSRPPR